MCVCVCVCVCGFVQYRHYYHRHRRQPHHHLHRRRQNPNLQVSQNLETVLFKEKFIDWPDSDRILKVKGHDASNEAAENKATTNPCEVREMLKMREGAPFLLLEGYHIGRGNKWIEWVDGIQWEHEMLTSDLEVWNVSESGCVKLGQASFGQFHAGDTYVVRWRYNVNQISHNLKGDVSKKQVSTGRHRCAYFFWQGVESSINEKGASALMTVELNQDNGPHVRIVEGKEPSCFIDLFSRRPMIIHRGKRFNQSKSSPKSDVKYSRFEPAVPSPLLMTSSSSSSLPRCRYKLYAMRNDFVENAYLLEVECRVKNLRSRGSYLLIDVKQGDVVVWHGCKSSSEVRNVMKKLADAIMSTECPAEIGLNRTAATTSTATTSAATTSDATSSAATTSAATTPAAYIEMEEDTRPFDHHTPRLFHLTMTTSELEFEEVTNLTSEPGQRSSPFPFMQSDIYAADQPALFLVDNHNDVFLWQGWWPSSSADRPNLQTGSATARFAQMRKAAVKMTLEYCTEKRRQIRNAVTASSNDSSDSNDNATSFQIESHLVHAGCEPPRFTSIFPLWSVDQDAAAYAAEMNHTRTPMVSLHEMNRRFNRSTFTLEELKARPLPDGVDPLKLETYLADDEFEVGDFMIMTTMMTTMMM
ncbi:hypothetical protein HELRODRAFT_114173 [Helobdella robusta]|uniref:Gelsolin-like domain-containing protein n=1 Tax=Helobdella robusta TaxID=6412 RepID=T1EFZ8_HELRO|nr:hypothetical protein HELRODRAFT_114173 [Helobdella robusta]ESN97493.1 hypothetical protein HELRODRAFT_114173 [Helobdella robusta]